jgi:uncharacterized membrane protein YtjA (UPF0391 family)
VVLRKGSAEKSTSFQLFQAFKNKGIAEAERIWQRKCKGRQRKQNRPAMASWTLIFLLLTLIAGLLGFSSLAGSAASVAQVTSMIFLVLLVVSGFSNVPGGKNS